LQILLAAAAAARCDYYHLTPPHNAPSLSLSLSLSCPFFLPNVNKMSYIYPLPEQLHQYNVQQFFGMKKSWKHAGGCAHQNGFVPTFLYRMMLRPVKGRAKLKPAVDWCEFLF
jgi:hypothetical protein